MIPTPDSTGIPLKLRYDRVVTAIQRARLISTNERNLLNSGNTSIERIIDFIYIPFTASSDNGGIWKTISEFSTGKAFHNFYSSQLFQRLSYSPNDANLTTDRVVLDGNLFSLNAKVEWQGSGVPPAPLVKGTNYWIKDKQGNGVSFSATEGGAKIALTDQGSGSTFVSLRLSQDFSDLITAIEAVIDEIINIVPVTTGTLELRNLIFDKNLLTSSTGLENASLTPAQTSVLRTKLLDVTNVIGTPLT